MANSLDSMPSTRLRNEPVDVEDGVGVAAAMGFRDDVEDVVVMIDVKTFLVGDEDSEDEEVAKGFARDNSDDFREVFEGCIGSAIDGVSTETACEAMSLNAS